MTQIAISLTFHPSLSKQVSSLLSPLECGDSALFATTFFLFIFAASFEDMPHCSAYDINQASGERKASI
jgi:hypothetical protein